MVLNTEQQLLVDGLLPRRPSNERTGLIDERYRWPNRVVPVALTDGHFDESQRQHVWKALRTLESVSCLTFVNHTVEENFVQMTVSARVVNSFYNRDKRKIDITSIGGHCRSLHVE